VTEERVLITEDTDFGALLARNQSLHPSLILFRSADPLTPEEQSRLLLANLDALAEELAAGCIVSIGRGHLRVRPLPVGPDRERDDRPLRREGTTGPCAGFQAAARPREAAK
jgi:hypothetical protein